MNRILPEDVVAAYKTGWLRPIRQQATVMGDETCAVGALARQKDNRLKTIDGTSECLHVLFLCGFDVMYLRAFIHGFDGTSDSHPDDFGYADGVATRLACIEAFGEF